MITGLIHAAASQMQLNEGTKNKENVTHRVSMLLLNALHKSLETDFITFIMRSTIPLLVTVFGIY
jgi:hypothetical protein